MNNFLRKADVNLKESIKNIAINSKKGEVIEADDYLISSVGIETNEAHANAAFCNSNKNVDRVFKEIDDYYKSKNLSYVFWIRDGIDNNIENLLKQKGYKAKRDPGMPIMIIDQKIDLEYLQKDRLQIVNVKNTQHIRDFITVVRNCFSLGENLAHAMFSSDKVVNGKNNKSYLIYYKNRPVSAVQTYKAGGVSGIYWVSTQEDIRGKGLGKLITSIGTNAALELGSHFVVLQASTLGEYVYQKLGYKTIGLYRTYLIKNMI